MRGNEKGRRGSHAAAPHPPPPNSSPADPLLHHLSPQLSLLISYTSYFITSLFFFPLMFVSFPLFPFPLLIVITSSSPHFSFCLPHFSVSRVIPHLCFYRIIKIFLRILSPFFPFPYLYQSPALTSIIAFSFPPDFYSFVCLVSLRAFGKFSVSL